VKEALKDLNKGGRLSTDTLRHLEKRAVRFRQLVNWMARRKVEGRQFESVNGAMFAICAELIQRRTDKFCVKADDEFDSIEAHGQEPELDDDWLAEEITGEKDNFYFSTDSIVKGLPPLPRRTRDRTLKGDLDEQMMAQVVEEAVQSFEQALAVSHVEQPHQWIENIKRALENNSGILEFWELNSKTGLSQGALWLGLLLGHENWTLRQHCFYGTVVVSLKDQE